MARSIRNIAFIGAGNLATHLARVFLKKGFLITGVWNRTPERGIVLAKKVGARFTEDITRLNPASDLFMIAISDLAIAQIADKIITDHGIIVHTAGSVSIRELGTRIAGSGVFYPVQTFSNKKRISFTRIPVCIEGSDPETLEVLTDFARQITPLVYHLDSGQRKILHMTAVFAGNFTNYMYAVAEDILRNNDIPFELLKPLILRTSMNIHSPDIFRAQTGPAIREDFQVIGEHLRLLGDQDSYHEIYDLLTKNIIKHKQRNV